jgi:predicted nucleic acid-binding Zn ribbon protein
MEEELILCSKCGESWPSSGFYWSKGQIKRPCKQCFHEWHRGRYVPKNGADDAPRNCIWCGASYRPKGRRVSFYCSQKCKEVERKESGQQREQHLQRKYGISAADYDRILAEQSGGCALCGVKPEELTQGRYRTYLHVDHCHDTGRVRGLLCPEHNLMLGRFGDSPEMFRKVLEYLEAATS